MRNLFLIVLVALTYVGLSACGGSGEDVSFSECNDYVANELFGKVYEKAKVSDVLTNNEIKVVECAAESGNAKAQLFLGGGYLTGKFLKKDSGNAFEWLMKASSNGDYEAALLIFSMHLVGVEKENIGAFFDVMEAQLARKNYAAIYVVSTSYCLGFYSYDKDENKCNSMMEKLKKEIDVSSKERLAVAIRSSRLEGSIKSYLFAKYMSEDKE